MTDRLKCFLADDEKDAIENLTRLLAKYCPDTIVTGSANSVHEAVKYLSVEPVDVLLLDIRMGNDTGLDLLERLPAFAGSLIFVTAYDEFGLRAIKFSATDYLLKPVDPAELRSAIAKAHRKKSLENTQQQISMLLQSVSRQSSVQQKKIALADAEEVRYVNIEDIHYCRSSNSYTTFYLDNNQKLTVSRPIAEYESILSQYGFIRTHQSYLVNKYRIRSYKKEDGGYLLMENDSVVPVSRQRKGFLKDLF